MVWVWELSLISTAMKSIPSATSRLHLFLPLAALIVLGTATSQAAARAGGGLQVFYDFQSASGPVVKDTSGAGEPINLRITKPEAVKRSKGSLEFRDAAMARSAKPATRLIEAIRRSGEITIEAWVRPASANQKGPARIVTLSRNGNERNFTLGQEGDLYDVRLRTLGTSGNGIPSVSSPRRSLKPRLTHVVYTRDRSGRTRIYLDGKKVKESRVGGGTDNWHGQFRLGLGNEISGDRQWKGTFHLIAIYSRDLQEREVIQNFKAGVSAKAGPRLANGEVSAEAHFFNTKIAPLLSKHCLECHDASVRKGKLDLAHKTAALAWDDGSLLKPGKHADSVLWQVVESNDMPEDRDPLSAEEKALLKKWIDSGAKWTLNFIDPATYAHGSGQAHQNWLRRLTNSEYIRTVKATTGVDIAKDARRLLPRELRADGFSNTAYNLNVDLKHVEAYAQLAGIVVERMDVPKFAKRFHSSRRLIDKDNRALIERMGRWLLRGPLEEHEIVAYRGISTGVAAAGGNFEEATRFVVEAMLQSPRFIYRMETQKGDGGVWPVSGHELANRMSYTVWGAPPDKELMQAADNGELFAEENQAAHLKRMLADPRAIDRSMEFAAEWLNLNRLSNLRPNRKKFPNWDPELADDMRRETLAFFKDVVWNQKRPMADLFNAQVAWLTPRLARHYGVSPKGEGTEPVRHDVSKVPGRGGILTQGSVLTVGGDEASMVTRGLFVLHDVLRGVVQDPPPGLDVTPVPTKPGLSQRKIAEDRIQNKSCGGCHAKFEPLAFALEKFDGLGSWHENDEHGNKLREDGNILMPGAAKAIDYQTTAQFMDYLASSDRVSQSIAWKLAQFALGRPLGPEDAPALDEIHRESKKRGGTYHALISAIIQSDLVQTTRTEKDG